MSEQTIRWGVLGASNIARRVVPDIRRVPGASVVAVAASDGDRAKAWADENEIPNAFSSYAELAESSEVDIVYVTTVHSAHHTAVKLCLEAGKPVIVEKPFTVHLSDAQELVELARERGVFLMEAMWTRLNPLMVEMKSRIAAGDIGELLQVRANLGPSSGRNPRLWDLSLGGGILLECVVYPLAFASHFLGEPNSVAAKAHFKEGIDDATSLLLGYESGAQAVLTSSIARGVAKGPVSDGVIIGTEGWIDVPTGMFCPEAYVIHRRGEDPEEVVREKVGNGYVEEAAEATRCVREGLLESPLMPLDDTLGVMRVIDETYQQTGIKYPSAPLLV